MPERIWTASNFLSFLRIVLVLPMVYCLRVDFPNNRLWAAGIIIAAALSDFFDGYLARKLHQVSEFGKILDPLADKIAAVAVAYLLVLTGDVAVWFVVVVILRDVLIVFGGMYIRNKKRIIVQSNWPGKITVTAIAVYLLLSTLRVGSLETFRLVTLWFCVAMMVLSLAMYSKRLFIGRNIEVG